MKNENIDKYFERIYLKDLIIHQSLKLFRLLGLASILYFGVVFAIDWNSDSKMSAPKFVGVILSGLITSQVHKGVLLTKENVVRPEDLEA